MFEEKALERIAVALEAGLDIQRRSMKLAKLGLAVASAGLRTLGDDPEMREWLKPLMDELDAALSDSVETCSDADAIRCILEQTTDRACKRGLPGGMDLSAFVDWLRGLWPELYVKE